MARPRGLYAGVGPGVTPSRDGVLLYGHLLGDLASHEAPIPHDITPRVSLPFLLFFSPILIHFDDKFLNISFVLGNVEHVGMVDNFDKIYQFVENNFRDPVTFSYDDVKNGG